MIEVEIDITTQDGVMDTFVTYPDLKSPDMKSPDMHNGYPVILFLMDAPGKRPELEVMATRLATSGYCVILPNLYYRKAKHVALTTRDKMNEYMDSLTTERVLEDCQHLLHWADKQDFASNGDAGVVGYCMSGPFAFAAAGLMSDRIRAGASIHGVRLMTEASDSPHLHAKNIRGEFYIGCAESDHWAPVELIQQLAKYIETHEINATIEWYPETEHGFVFPDRLQKYHFKAAERHWHRLNDLFGRHLLPNRTR